ncbi:Hypothetical protein MVR_LOCUS324 [uncultured virus]|nr:Hypothetical protein MVR_LOCUS324 [uncultured virus]
MKEHLESQVTLSPKTKVDYGLITLDQSQNQTYSCLIITRINLLWDLSIIAQCMSQAVYFDYNFCIQYPFRTTQDDTLVFPQIQHVIVNYLVKSLIDVNKHFPNLEAMMIDINRLDHDLMLGFAIIELIYSLTCDTLYIMISAPLHLESDLNQIIKLIQVVVNNPKIQSLVIYNNSRHFIIKPPLDIVFGRTFNLYIKDISIRFGSKRNLIIHKL